MDPGALVLRDGDRVEAWGRLLQTPPGTFFEPPLPVRLAATTDVMPPSRFAVPVVGADLDDVEMRRDDGERVEGYATVRGRWLHDRLLVDTQAPRRPRELGSGPEWVEPPCAPPPEGWPHGARDSNLSVDGLDHLKDSGAAVAVTMFRPSPTQVVLVVAAEDPPAVHAALAPQAGARLCVVKSRFSRPQVDAARDELVRRMDTDLIWATGETSDEQGQPVVTVDVARLGTDLAAWIADQPEGLVRVRAWLAPQPAG